MQRTIHHNRYLRDKYGHDQVIDAHVVLHRSELDKLKRKKRQLLRKLDRAEHPSPPSTCSWWSRKRISIADTKDKLRQVSAAIRSEQAISRGKPTGIAFVTFRNEELAYAFANRQVLEQEMRGHEEQAVSISTSDTTSRVWIEHTHTPRQTDRQTGKSLITKCNHSLTHRFSLIRCISVCRLILGTSWNQYPTYGTTRNGNDIAR
jgi:hypothetical protein